MKKTISISLVLLILVGLFPLFATFNPEYSDYLFYNKGSYYEDLEYLESEFKNTTDKEVKAQILWRMSRTKLTITDDYVDKDDKDLRLSEYIVCRTLAEESLALHETPNGYHWLSSAIGRWGQTKGPLNSLSKAGEMRDYCFKVQNDFNADMSDTWYVLGVLYNSLPGSPLSFGNNNYAISYMRRCLITQDTENRLNLTNYLELANQLYDRNWKADKREKEFNKMQQNYNSATTMTDKMRYYEGFEGAKAVMYYSTMPQNKISDRQESVMLLRYAKALFELSNNPLENDKNNYEKIINRLKEIT